MKLIAIAAAALLVASTPAWAASNRVWVSGHGVDQAGCGAPTAPCRSLQYAHDAVNAGGEVDILDPAGYGAISITKAISIVNDGVGAAGVQATSGDAISINVGPTDAVYLKGLNIDGVNGGGTNGVHFVAGLHLAIDHCAVRHFASYGVMIEPVSGANNFEVRDTVLSDNHGGLFIDLSSGAASVTAVLDRVSANSNGYAGIAAIAEVAGTSVRMTVSYSDASNNGTSINGGYGVASDASAGSADVEVNNSTLSGNGLYGFFSIGNGKAHIARSVLEFNGQMGIENDSAATYSAGDNHIEGNGNYPVWPGGSLAPDTLY